MFLDSLHSERKIIVARGSGTCVVRSDHHSCNYTGEMSCCFALYLHITFDHQVFPQALEPVVREQSTQN